MRAEVLDTFEQHLELATATLRHYEGLVGAAHTVLQNRDEVEAFDLLFIDDLIRHFEYHRAVRNGEIGSMWVVYKFWLHTFKGAGMSIYANLLAGMFVQFEYELHDDLKTAYEATWLYNRSGKKGKWHGTDEFLEEDVGVVKGRASFAKLRPCSTCLDARQGLQRQLYP